MAKRKKVKGSQAPEGYVWCVDHWKPTLHKALMRKEKMLMAKKRKFVTPLGTASYPYLTAPDTKFNKEGDYTVKLILEDEPAQPLITLIDAHREEALAQAKVDPKNKNSAKKKVKLADPPYRELLNDDGEETGKWQFTFKQKAVITKKDGSRVHIKPKLFDSKNTEITKMKGYVGGGSRIKIAYEVIPFFTSMLGSGVSLRLKAVQIIELVSGGNGASYGFEEEEDGFEGDPHEEMKDEEPPFDADEPTDGGDF